MKHLETVRLHRRQTQRSILHNSLGHMLTDKILGLTCGAIFTRWQCLRRHTWVLGLPWRPELVLKMLGASQLLFRSPMLIFYGSYLRACQRLMKEPHVVKMSVESSGSYKLQFS